MLVGFKVEAVDITEADIIAGVEIGRVIFGGDDLKELRHFPGFFFTAGELKGEKGAIQIFQGGGQISRTEGLLFRKASGACKAFSTTMPTLLATSKAV